MHKIFKHYPIALILLFLISFGCKNAELQNQDELNLPFQEYSMEGNAVQQELDEIYSLLNYSIVFKYWQPDSIPRFERRGYNIGTVLVDKNYEIVNWALNSINSTNNTTQHGEVRAIMGYLDTSKSFNLKDFTLYTTLEPCAMCAGMMVMTSVKRVVYGQKDVEYSKALDRLALDSKKIGGYAPYPRVVISDPSPSKFRTALDEAYSTFLNTDEEKFMAKFLSTLEAYEIYRRAYEQLLKYKVVYPENEDKYKKAVLFFNRLPN